MSEHAPPPDPAGPGQTAARERRVPWSAPEAVAVFVIATALGFVLAAPVFALGSAAGLDEEALTALLIPLSPLLLGLTTIAVVAIRHQGQMGKLLGWRRAGPADWLVGLGVAVVGYFGLNVGLGTLLQWVLTSAGYDMPVVQETFRQAATSPQAVWGLVVGAVLLAPIAEEVLFRGMLFQAVRDRLGVGWGIWVSAAAFALTHASFGASWLSNGLLLAVILPFGALLAWAFHRRGTLLVPVVAHMLFNVVNVAALIAGVA